MKNFFQGLLLILLIAFCAIGYIVTQNQETIIEAQATLLSPRIQDVYKQQSRLTIFATIGDIDEKSTYTGSITNISEKEVPSIKVSYNSSTNPIIYCEQQGATVKKDQLLIQTKKQVIISPVTGRVESILWGKGNVTITLLNYDDYVIIFSLPVAAADRLEQGRSVELTYEKRRLMGKVRSVSWLAKDERVCVIISYEDEYCITRVGATASLEIVTEEKKNALLIPKECVLRIGKEKYAVQIVMRGEMEEDITYPITQVKIGMMNDKLVEITEGIGSATELLYRPESQYGEPLSEVDDKEVKK